MRFARGLTLLLLAAAQAAPEVRAQPADVFPVQPRELQTFMRLIELHGSDANIVPGEPRGLPRLRYEVASADGTTTATEVDSYRFLGTLVAQVTDYTRTRSNARGQTLSTELLLAFNCRRIAVPASTSPALEPNGTEQRFLTVQLKRDDFQREEGPISPVETLPPYQFAHLLRGLGWVDQQRGKLD